MAEGTAVDLDLYGLLDIEITATESEVKRAYRQKALKCHPDKNPDDPKAAEIFLQLSKAVEVLLNEPARVAYDKLLLAKKAAQQRHHALDSTRKRFKEELIAREKAAAACVIPDEIKLKNEIERLRKEGASLIKEEMQSLIKESMREAKPMRDVKLCRIKVCWNIENGSNKNEYTEENLCRIFSKYGKIVAFVMSENKALVEFEDTKAAELAIKIEIGFVENPLTVDYASSKQRKRRQGYTCSGSHNPRDSETLSDRAQRQAEERKRIIEQMLKEDVD